MTKIYLSHIFQACEISFPERGCQRDEKSLLKAVAYMLKMLILKIGGNLKACVKEKLLVRSHYDFDKSLKITFLFCNAISNS